MYFCFRNFFKLILPPPSPFYYLFFFISFPGLFSTLFPQFIVLILIVSGIEINTYIIPNLHISNRVNLSFKKKNLTWCIIIIFFPYLYNIDYIKIQVVHIWCFLFMSFFYEHFFSYFSVRFVSEIFCNDHCSFWGCDFEFGWLCNGPSKCPKYR